MPYKVDHGNYGRSGPGLGLVHEDGSSAPIHIEAVNGTVDLALAHKVAAVDELYEWLDWAHAVLSIEADKILAGETATERERFFHNRAACSGALRKARGEN